MKYGNFTLGQIEAGINKIGGEDNWMKLLKGELKVVPVDKESTGKTAKIFYPKRVFRSKKGLYVSSNFINKIVEVAKPTEAGRIFLEVSYVKLTKSVTGKELLLDNMDQVWDSTIFCLWLNTKLKQQSNGQNGSFLTNGCGNLFLVGRIDIKVFVVSVSWNSIPRKWYVSAWDLGYGWNAGNRFFSKPIVF